MKRLGLSMVEVAIGILLMALILIPSMNVISSGTKTVVSTRDHAQAVFWAQQIMEQARGYPFKFLDEDDSTLTVAEKPKTFENEMKTIDDKKVLKINNITYSVKNFKITRVEHKNDPNSKTVALISFEIEYVGKDNKTHALEFHSAISKRD